MTGFLQLPHFSEADGLVHGFTTREIGGDCDRLAVKLKMLSSQIYYLKQIHSEKVVFIDENTELSQIGPADALVTDRKDILIGVRTADCVPILIHDPEREVVAAIHAGYKGILAGVIQNTIAIMTERLGCQAKDFIWGIGPAICINHYEVGPDVIHYFKDKFRDRFVYRTDLGERPHLDIKASAKMILTDLGLDEHNGMDIGLCTYERDDLFFSYRRLRKTENIEAQGRHFNFIGMVS